MVGGLNVNVEVSKVQRFECETPTCFITPCGNVVDVTMLSNCPHGSRIQKLDADHYVTFETGEVREYRHTENRKENILSLKRTLRRIRQIVNLNVTDPDRVLWVTLTYAENMTDPERLHVDYVAFWKRFKRYIKTLGVESAEYIAVAEPQGRGAWHLHCFFIFPCRRPFIENAKLRALWGNGFVNVQKINGDIDNLGAYFSAYLGDMEIPADKLDMYGASYKISEIKAVQGVQGKKYFIKGGRLNLYPSYFQMLRCSKGIKRPDTIRGNLDDVKKITRGVSPSYEKNLEIKSDSFSLSIKTCQYNLIRSK